MKWKLNHILNGRSMIKEKLTDALITKAMGNNLSKEDAYYEGIKIKLKMATSDTEVAFYTQLLKLPMPVQAKSKTVASKAYHIAKAEGFSPRQCSRIGLLFLSYERGKIDFADLCNKAGLSENDILNKYGNAIS